MVLNAKTESGLAANKIIADLRTRVADCFAAAIPPGPLSLVDFPDHSNVGDSAIWLGEVAWLDDAGRTPVFSAALSDFSADGLRAAAPGGPILIHGGGNFGTTWPKHEELRLHLLQSFPGRPIIQMPQSIHYDDPARADAMAAAIKAHGAFTLLVRDARSLAFARERFDCDVRLCPDAALYLGPQARTAATTDILALMRTDHERVVAPAGMMTTDWLDEAARDRNAMRARIKLDSLLAFTEQGKRLRRHRMLASWRLRRGLGILSQGRVVVTDRLHAHILSLLLDIPHVALDNSYGKVSGFAEQWTDRYRGFRRATAFDDAIAQARQLTEES